MPQHVEVKADQGLRIYRYENSRLKLTHFESLPGALAMHLRSNGSRANILVTRYYSDPAARQDGKLERRDFPGPVLFTGRPKLAIR